MPEIPKIVSVDDHVIEPAERVAGPPAREVQGGRAPARAPQGQEHEVRRRRVLATRRPADNEDGTWCDWWLIEDLQYPLTRLSAAAGYPRDEITVSPITMDDMRKGCWDQKARLEDMDVNHVEASLAFPSFPRFCGQTFAERKDKELGDLCVKAYNDWMIDEWCAGTNGRLIPLIIVQLWDPKLAADEIRRNAARGCHAVTFSEIPPFLGFPSIHDKDGYWDPFLAACEETDTVINMHIGSSSKMPSHVGRRAGRGRLARSRT